MNEHVRGTRWRAARPRLGRVALAVEYGVGLREKDDGAVAREFRRGLGDGVGVPGPVDLDADVAVRRQELDERVFVRGLDAAGPDLRGTRSVRARRARRPGTSLLARTPRADPQERLRVRAPQRLEFVGGGAPQRCRRGRAGHRSSWRGEGRRRHRRGGAHQRDETPRRSHNLRRKEEPPNCCRGNRRASRSPS